ncbi:MAG: hypothetical protein JWO01_2588 [Microbacteriaceae bacterium]|nr:hypothetical protein [Microbacteriaceae bacterium]
MGLLIVYGLLSVALTISAFFNRIQFEGCGHLGSNRECNYALSTGALYSVAPGEILLFAAAVSLVVRAYRGGKPSWPIPLMGSAFSFLAYLAYVWLMDAATR